ncbi:MAG: arylesterase [bacterium]|nr:arylesterase [bacterium]
MLSLGGVGAEEVERRTILFLGDSLTAGYGLDKDRAFPALVQAKIDSLGWAFQVVNAGLSGETSAGGLRRIDWLLRRRVDVLILELGGNDGLRGISVSAMQENLQGMMDRVWKKYPDVRIILAGMEAPPNMGEAYTSAFRMVFSELRKKNKILLIPFLLEGVGGIPELNLADRIHPNVEGHRVVAENVWEVLKPVLEE